MNTSRSDTIIQKNRENPHPFLRKAQTFTVKVNTSPEKLFPLFCPSREADWLPGWDCSLIFSESGYAEKLCIFATEGSEAFEEGLWVITKYEPSEHFELVRFQEDVIAHLKITLKETGGITVSEWTYTLTALTIKGNSEIENLGDLDKSQELSKALNHYVETGGILENHSILQKLHHKLGKHK